MQISSTFGIIWSIHHAIPMTLHWLKHILGQQCIWIPLPSVARVAVSFAFRRLFCFRVAGFFARSRSFNLFFFSSARRIKSTCILRIRMSHRKILHSFYETFKKPILIYSSSEFRSLDGDPLIRYAGVIQLFYISLVRDQVTIKEQTPSKHTLKRN